MLILLYINMATHSINRVKTSRSALAHRQFQD